MVDTIKKNLSKIKVITGPTSWELSLPKTDSSGNLQNVAYTNISNDFQQSQNLVLQPTSNYESTELVGKSSKYNRTSGTFTSGTDSSYFVTSLKDTDNKIVASSNLQVESGSVSAFFEVPNKDGSTSAKLGISFNPTTNLFDAVAPNTSSSSADNAIVTKHYLEEQLEGYVSSGEAVNVETATNDVKGIVLLSDSAGDADSINGGTAVTPKALKDVVTAYKQADALLRNDLEQQIAQGGGGSLSYIVTPTIINPTQDSTDQSTLINIIGTAFKSVFDDDARISRHFQIASDAEFLTIVKEKEVNADSWVIDPPQLADTTKYYVRIKDKATSGYSSFWSPIRTFTTGEGLKPADPVITLKGYNNSPVDIGSGLTIETQAFSVPGGSDTHKATSWSITTKSRANVWESLNDTVNKTSIVVPVGTLQKATEYVLTVVFHGTNYGDSNPVTVDFTTSSDFGTVNTPTLTVEGAPNAVYETPTFTGGAFSNTREPDTHEATDWEIVPSSGGGVVWQSLNDTTNKTSIKVPSDILHTLTSYKARLRYKGTNFGWSEWVEVAFTTASIFAQISTPGISGPTTNVYNSQIFTSSAFSMPIGGPGNHDKTDWVLVKADAPSVEIWSSKNDTANKTSCPSLSSVLEVSTNYILKVRYHDSTNDIWSDYGTLAFTTVATFAIYYDIGTPGAMGFGVGLCDDEAGLEALGLRLMVGGEDPNNDNYGNYDRTDGKGVWVFVPAFCYRFTGLSAEEQAKSPSYFKIKSFKDFNFSEQTANEAGYTLHQAFVDGGKPQKGFFIAKYLMSKGVKSVKNGITLSLISTGKADASSQAEGNGASGVAHDAMTLSKTLGQQYNCASVYMYSAIAMLSYIHGIYSTSAAVCAWYDPEGTTNYPKGCNNNALGDCDDGEILYQNGDNKLLQKPNTGSANYFARTTHNGQACGICDVNGCIEQVSIGAIFYGQGLYVAPASAKFTAYTKDNANSTDSSLYVKAINLGDKSYKWGNAAKNCLYTDQSGTNRALCGVWPNNPDSSGTNEFGNDLALSSYYSATDAGVVRCAGSWSSFQLAGVWYRYISSRYYSSSDYSWYYSGATWGFRSGAYLPEKGPFNITLKLGEFGKGTDTVVKQTDENGKFVFPKPMDLGMSPMDTDGIYSYSFMGYEIGSNYLAVGDSYTFYADTEVEVAFKRELI